MTPHELLESFETLADAPDGVKRLRELVLQLGVQGKLVPQSTHDESAQLVLSRVADERQRMASAGLLSPLQGAKGAIVVCPPLFETPPSWQWAQLSSLSISITDGDHQPPPKSDQGYPFVVIGDILDGRVDLSSARRVPASYFDALSWIKKPIRSDLLYTVTGSFGTVIVLEDEPPFCVQRHIGIIKAAKGMDSRYLSCALRSVYAQKYAANTAKGTAQKTVSLAALRMLPVPVPPLAEQRRIVARVDELMNLLDRLEAARAVRDEVRRAARDAALAALRDAESTDAFELAWTRVSGQMDSLFIAPEDVLPLRQTILQVAVRGRLTPQDPADEPAKALLERVANEKKRMVEAGEIRPDKSGAGCDDAPSWIPKSWCWSRLGDLLIECRNGVSSTPNDSSLGIRVLRISAATGRRDGVVNLNDHKHVGLSPAETAAFSVRQGDLLVCRFNGNLHYVGTVARVAEDPDVPTVYPDKLIRIRPILLRSEYVQCAVNSGIGRTQIESMAATTAGNIGINGGQLRSLLLPVPPLAEQHRIVAKVDALMALCDGLEARLAAAQELQAQFAAAAVHHLDV